MSQAPHITGTEGERLDATVTVDSTFGSQQTQTIELRIEDGGTVVHTDTQDVTLVDSTDSQQITLSWPTSSGDKGVYDLFIESDQDAIQRLVEVTDVRVVDDFEDNNLSEYSVNTDAPARFCKTQSNDVISGNYSLKIEGKDEGASCVSTSGLDYYPKRGDTVSFKFLFENADNCKTSIIGFASSDTLFERGYDIAFRIRDGTFDLEKRTSSSPIILDSQNVNYSSYQDTVLDVTFDWGASDLTVTLKDGGTTVAQLSATDTEFDSGGIEMFGTWGQSNDPNRYYLFDDIEVLR